MLMLMLAICAQSMPLNAAVQGTLEHAPAAEIAQAQIDMARAGARGAQARLMPTITASAGAFLQNEIVFDFTSQLPDIPLIDTSTIDPTVVVPGQQLSANLTATQPLIVPAAWGATRAATDAVSVSEAQADASEETLVKMAVESWHRSAQLHALVVDATEALSQAERLQERSQALVDLGVSSADQVLAFQLAVANARGQLSSVQAASTMADGVLEQLCGITGGADTTSVPAEVPDLSKTLANAHSSQQTVANSGIKAATSARLAQQRASWPVLLATGTATYLEPVPAFGERFNWKVGLVASVPLFAGGANRAAVTASEAKLRGAVAAARAVDEQVQVGVRTAHGSLVMAMAALAQADTAVDLADRAVVAQELRVSGGGESLLGLQQAQIQQLAARARRTMARSEAARAADMLVLAERGTVAH